MKMAMNFTVAPTMKAPTAAITRVEPHLVTDCSKCEGNINVGLFFDGTNNNRDADLPSLRHTNVARLYDAYLQKPRDGHFALYIPGVGTRFPELREEGESDLGSGFAVGCEQRVLFALLYVFNAIHRSGFVGTPFFDDAQVTALCCNQYVDQESGRNDDRIALATLGLSNGLRMPAAFGDGARAKTLKAQARLLEAKLVNGKPRIKECFIDVFGFSRGAAEARVFCSWLDELLADGKLAGVIVHLRFVGLMDTVASAGFWSGLAAATTGVNGGHSGWADSHFLRIPASVHNCVHMIAAHELRKNFPLDTITIDGVLPPHCLEFAYPGAHSDVGGGYAPCDLGISVGQNANESDALKLAQIPLNHMLECAAAAGAPMKKGWAMDNRRGYDPFALAPMVQKAYDDFLTFSTPKPRAVHEWLQPYLTWRWQVRKSYKSLNHVAKASPKERELLLKYNDKLIADAALLERTAAAPSAFTLLRTLISVDAKRDAAYLLMLDPEARTVLSIAQAAPPTDARLHKMFDLYVHDSLAGFDHKLLETTGYWRYRKGFLGSPKRLIAENDGAADASSAAA